MLVITGWRDPQGKGLSTRIMPVFEGGREGGGGGGGSGHSHSQPKILTLSHILPPRWGFVDLMST